MYLNYAWFLSRVEQLTISLHDSYACGPARECAGGLGEDVSGEQTYHLCPFKRLYCCMAHVHPLGIPRVGTLVLEGKTLTGRVCGP